MDTLFEAIHEKMIHTHNKAIDLSETDKKRDYLMGQAQAYADVLDLLDNDFKGAKWSKSKMINIENNSLVNSQIIIKNHTGDIQL